MHLGKKQRDEKEAIMTGEFKQMVIITAPSHA
jgi:hypothetical protein